MLTKTHRTQWALVGALVGGSLLLSPMAHSDTAVASPTVAVNTPFTGFAWTAPTFALTSDGATTFAFEATPGTTTDDLSLSGFGFSIPAGAVIDGIEVSVEGHSGGGGAAIPTFVPALAKVVGFFSGSFSVGGGMGIPATPPSCCTIIVDGSLTDLWSQTWSPADVNAATFGVDIYGTDLAAVSADAYAIDHVFITVHFTPGAGLPLVTPLSLTLTALALTLLGMFAVRRVRRQRG